MNKKIKIIIEVAVIAALVGAGAYFYLHNKTAAPVVVENNGSDNQVADATDTIPILPLSEILVPSGPDKNLLVIALAVDDFDYIEADAKSGMTALDLLKQGGTELAIEIKTKDYAGMGILVEQIDNLTNGTDKKYWIYYVNGEQAKVGADKYVLKGGDKVEWRFEASPY